MLDEDRGSTIMCLKDDVQHRLGEKCPDCPQQKEDPLQQGGVPIFSSPVSMVQKVAGMDRRFHVLLKVYKSMYDFYAVVSQDRVIVKDCGYFRLKNCTVVSDEKDLTVQVIQRNCEGLALTFVVPDLEQHRRLVSVLQNDDSGSLDYQSDESQDSDKENTDSLCVPPRSRGVGGCSRLHRIWKRDLSPRSPRQGTRKTSMPSLSENEELQSEEEE